MRQHGYISVKKPASARLVEKKSVFIAHVAPVKTDEEAKDFINKIKTQYSDATHNVYAYILREQNISRFSEDGEPRGTAGLPIMEMLCAMKITDISSVVTRYFGGTLLGAGGLARAYTAVVKKALLKAEVAEWSLFYVFSVKTDYGGFERLSRPFEGLGVRVTETVYSQHVLAECAVKAEVFDKTRSKILELTGGRAEITLTGEKFLPE